MPPSTTNQHVITIFPEEGGLATDSLQQILPLIADNLLTGRLTDDIGHVLDGSREVGR